MNTVYAAKDAKRMIERGEDLVMPVTPSDILKDWFNKQTGYIESVKFIKLTDTNRIACSAITGVNDLLDYAMAKNYDVYLHRSMMKTSKDQKYNKEVYQQKFVYYFKMTKKAG